MKKKFAIIGAAGFIAPKHVRAIKENDGDLVVAYDICDTVGYLDKYFAHCLFFNKASDFSDAIDDLEVDYVSICTPSHLHTVNTMSILFSNKSVICEKPLSLEPSELDRIKKAETESKNSTVSTILQLAFHPVALAMIDRWQSVHGYEVEVKYYSPRGDWYHKSWKGNDHHSGGLITNIGIHILHLMINTFGEPIDFTLFSSTADRSLSKIKFMNGNKVTLDLNINKNIQPRRTISHQGEVFNLGRKLDQDLHTEAYRSIMAGAGFGIEDVRLSIELAYAMRS